MRIARAGTGLGNARSEAGWIAENSAEFASVPRTEDEAETLPFAVPEFGGGLCMEIAPARPRHYLRPLADAEQPYWATWGVI